NAGHQDPTVRIEDWPYQIVQPVGPHVATWAERVALLAATDDAGLLASHLHQAAGVVQETVGAVGAADPGTIRLRLSEGICRTRQTDTVEAGLVGACDGELSVGQILDALATPLEREPADLRARYVPVVRELV